MCILMVILFFVPRGTEFDVEELLKNDFVLALQNLRQVPDFVVTRH